MHRARKRSERGATRNVGDALRNNIDGRNISIAGGSAQPPTERDGEMRRARFRFLRSFLVTLPSPFTASPDATFPSFYARQFRRVKLAPKLRTFMLDRFSQLRVTRVRVFNRTSLSSSNNFERKLRSHVAAVLASSLKNNRYRG